MGKWKLQESLLNLTKPWSFVAMAQAYINFLFFETSLYQLTIEQRKKVDNS